MGIVNISLPKLKNHANNLRRAKRAKEFEPWDTVIAKQIPGNDLTIAETKRQEIRDKYAQIQSQIEETTDVNTLATIVHSL